MKIRRSPLLIQEGWLRRSRKVAKRPKPAQTGWSGTTCVYIMPDHPVRAYPKVASRYFLEGASTPPVSGGDYASFHVFYAFKNLLWLVPFILLAACRPAEPPAQNRSDSPQRIISVVPSATEMIFAFGLGDRIVGVSDYDRFPPEVESKPRIGGLLNPNIEKIIELKPDLVITYGSQDVLRNRLSSVGIRFHPFSHGNVEHTLQYISELGKVIGAEEQAGAIVNRIRKTLENVRATASADRPSVLLVHNRGAGYTGSFYTVGAKAFQHDLIEIAGGQNLFADVDREALQPSLEEVLNRAPDIIIETLPPPVGEAEVTQRKQDWQKLGLAKGRVYIVAESYMLVPGPRLDLAAQRFAEFIQKK
jgi:iron complex transport system substrate-binding protein